MTNNANIFIKPVYLEQICAIIKNIYPQSVVWAYGSRVGGDEKTAHNGSDFDLAIKSFGQANGRVVELREAFQESNLPFLVDIFNYNDLPESFKHEINKNYVVLYDGSLVQDAPTKQKKSGVNEK